MTVPQLQSRAIPPAATLPWSHTASWLPGLCWARGGEAPVGGPERFTRTEAASGEVGPGCPVPPSAVQRAEDLQPRPWVGYFSWPRESDDSVGCHCRRDPCLCPQVQGDTVTSDVRPRSCGHERARPGWRVLDGRWTGAGCSGHGGGRARCRPTPGREGRCSVSWQDGGAGGSVSVRQRHGLGESRR